MVPIRPLRRQDLEEIVSLYRRVLDPRPGLRADRLADYFARVYLDHPWVDDRITPLVSEHGTKIVGFLGVTPRPLIFAGDPIQSAIGSTFMVDPEHRNLLAGVSLLKAFLQGPQDVSIAEGNRLTRKMWLGLGGSVALQQSVHWLRPLRPATFGLRHLRLAGPLRPLGRLAAVAADRVLRTFTVRTRQEKKARLAVEPMNSGGFVEFVDELGQSYRLRPSYDLRSAEWMHEHLSRKKSLGRLMGALVRDDAGDKVGWYLWFHNPENTARLVQIGARPGRYDSVLDELMRDALDRGADAISGRLEPQLSESIAQQATLFSRRDTSLLVASRRQELLKAVWEGDTLLTPLECESWILYEEEPLT
jgi:hypothetical protein